MCQAVITMSLRTYCLGRARQRNHGLIVGFTRCEMQHNTTATDPSTHLGPTQSQIYIYSPLLTLGMALPLHTAYETTTSRLRYAVYTATASCALSLRPLAPTKPCGSPQISNRRKPPAVASWPFLLLSELCLHVLERILESSSSHGKLVSHFSWLFILSRSSPMGYSKVESSPAFVSPHIVLDLQKCRCPTAARPAQKSTEMY